MGSDAGSGEGTYNWAHTLRITRPHVLPLWTEALCFQLHMAENLKFI